VQQGYAVTQQFLERAIPCATVEGLLLLKMYALHSLYRQGSFARVSICENDIATLMHDYRPKIEALLAELAPHLRQSDRAAVRQIIGEIRRRIERFHGKFGQGRITSGRLRSCEERQAVDQRPGLVQGGSRAITSVQHQRVNGSFP
jgi:hypothetical protein